MIITNSTTDAALAMLKFRDPVKITPKSYDLRLQVVTFGNHFSELGQTFVHFLLFSVIIHEVAGNEMIRLDFHQLRRYLRAFVIAFLAAFCETASRRQIDWA